LIWKCYFVKNLKRRGTVERVYRSFANPKKLLLIVEERYDLPQLPNYRKTWGLIVKEKPDSEMFVQKPKQIK
jgi:hypothetical protein